MQYYAHISDDKVRRQTVKEHLTGTARRSELFAEAFRCGAWGYGCGILHDIGKYSQGFRKRLEGGSITDHATAGAQEMMGLYARTNPLAAYCAAYCISGHHSGLLDGGRNGDTAGEATLQGRLKKQLEDYSPYKDEVEMPDFPGLPFRQIGKGGFSLSFSSECCFHALWTEIIWIRSNLCWDTMREGETMIVWTFFSGVWKAMWNPGFPMMI